MAVFPPVKKNRKKSGFLVIEDQTGAFKDHIREHASEYFTGFQPEKTRVELINKQERATALLYQFAVSNGPETRTVFVKVLFPNVRNGQAPQTLFERPSLFPKAETAERHRLQYTAQKTIYDYFTSLDTNQLGAIRVLDYLPHYSAILTEGVREPSLRTLLLRKNRLFATQVPHDLLPAFRNVGKWLRVYHAMPKQEDVQVRDSHRDDYIEAINKLADFLGKAVGHEAFFRETARTVTQKANQLLPASLPLGLGHGDFALRNIFVGENARVLIFDTLANWQTPICKDIGYFLNDLKFSSLRGFGQGPAFGPGQLMAYERSFLKGYFENNPVPYAEVHLYEIFALFDRWASATARSSQKQAFHKFISQPRMILINRYCKKRINNLLMTLLQLQTVPPDKIADPEGIHMILQQ